MPTQTLRYQKLNGYKYRVVDDVCILLDWLKGISYNANYIRILPDGTLIAKKGYAWDGPSGLTFDTEDSLRGSLWHDVGYQLIRDGVLSKSLYKGLFDQLLRDVCIAAGMWEWRARLWFLAVVKFGNFYGLGDDRHGEIYTAP